MANMTKLTENTKKGKDLTVFIIIAILLITGISMTTYLLVRNARVEAAKMFEKAYTKILEFDELSNVFSKQEMEKEIVNLLDQVLAKYPNTSSGQRALFYKGYVYYYTENYEKAVKTFDYFVKKYKRSYLLDKSYYFLSFSYSDMKKNDEALEALKVFEKKLYKSYYTPLALYRLGNLYEIKGDDESALKYYKRVVNEFSDSSQKDIASNKIILLENDIEL